ncbi:DUF2332 family protein [Bacillus sp. HC-TM]
MYFCSAAACTIFYETVTSSKFFRKSDELNELASKIVQAAAERDVFHLYNNMWDRDLHIDYYINGNEYRETVGETEGHGRWFSWKIGNETLI